MKPAPFHRTIIIISIILVALTFLAGVSHGFDSVRAASVKPAVRYFGQVEKDTKPTPTPTPLPVSVSGDTTGIIALAIGIVIIVLVGALIGPNRLKRTKTS